MKMKATPKTLALLVSLAAGSVVMPGHAAETVCEKGKIRLMSVSAGEDSFMVSTGSTTSGLNRSQLFKLFATKIWTSGNYPRWQDRYSAIKVAYATDSYIHIRSSDNDCAGGQDEFQITVCQALEDCT